MKDHGADPDTQPPNIARAKQWSKDHASAGAACTQLLPLMPWGEDKSNPAFRDNIHQVVKCMTDKGLNVIETPDAEDAYWHPVDDQTYQTVPNAEQIVRDCYVSVMAKFDR